VALRITCIKNVKFNIIKIRTGCEYVRYFYYAENLNWAVQKLRLGRMCPESRWLDIAGLWQKRLLCHLCSVTGNKKIVFYDTTSRLNKLTKYEWSPSCLWSVGCQIVSVLTFLTGASTKLKREHVKQTLCSCAERLGDLAVATLPGASRSFNPALLASTRGFGWRGLSSFACAEKVGPEKLLILLRWFGTLRWLDLTDLCELCTWFTAGPHCCVAKLWDCTCELL